MNRHRLHRLFWVGMLAVLILMAGQSVAAAPVQGSELRGDSGAASRYLMPGGGMAFEPGFDLQSAPQQITSTATVAPAPTEAIAPTATSQPADPGRPLIVVESYEIGQESVEAGQEFTLQVRLKNVGNRLAFNIVATFTPGDFVPRVSGGVLAKTELDPGERIKLNQPLTASMDLLGKRFGTVVMTLSYDDAEAVSYTGTFNLSIPITPSRYVAQPTATPTPTPTALPSFRPQILITSYETDVPLLQPGYRFKLTLEIENLGNADAKRVTMIIGGGSGSSGGLPGTPDVGGVSGGSGDFGNFAPVAASNVQFLGDLSQTQRLQASAELIVNASTNPGAYPMKISFTYTDARGAVFNDDQVVTLLVYSPPQVDVNFYRPPDPFFAGQTGTLPLQVVNLGRKSVILGTMRVSTTAGQMMNDSILVGALDVGGYYTLDAMLTPDLPGPLELLITIDYTDDFNQPQVITRTLTIEVQEMVMPEPGVDGGGEGIPPDGGFPLPSEPETFWQKVLRFLKGLFGLDSGTLQPAPVEMPPSDVPIEEPVPRAPIKG